MPTQRPSLAWKMDPSPWPRRRFLGLLSIGGNFTALTVGIVFLPRNNHVCDTGWNVRISWHRVEHESRPRPDRHPPGPALDRAPPTVECFWALPPPVGEKPFVLLNLGAIICPPRLARPLRGHEDIGQAGALHFAP